MASLDGIFIFVRNKRSITIVMHTTFIIFEIRDRKNVFYEFIYSADIQYL